MARLLLMHVSVRERKREKIIVPSIRKVLVCPQLCKVKHPFLPQEKERLNRKSKGQGDKIAVFCSGKRRKNCLIFNSTIMDPKKIYFELLIFSFG